MAFICSPLTDEVPTPTISFTCDTLTSCSLTCGGDVTGAGTVTYDWKADGADLDVSEKTHITKNNNTEAFTCMMKNAVSQKESAPHRNSLYSPDETELTPSGECPWPINIHVQVPYTFQTYFSKHLLEP